MSAPEKKNETGQAKKAYHSPVIHYYGAIRTITESIGITAGALDGGMMGQGKTGY